MGEKNIMNAGTHNSLASVYRMDNNFCKALHHMKQALAIAEIAHGKENEEIASFNTNIGVLHLEKEKYAEALEWF